MGNKKHSSVVPGLVLITLGIIFILNNFQVIDFRWDSFWAYIVIAIGAIFWIGFLTDRKKDGFIMPGTILVIIGLIFIYCSRFGWVSMHHLWPFFILAPAIGFYAMYLLGNHDRGLLIPAGILTTIGLVFLFQSYRRIKIIWPMVVILIGVLLLIRKKDDKNGSDE